MYEMLSEYYFLLKSLHLIAVICWMAALFYMPRLFVYHADAAPDSELAATLMVMEKRLMRIIMTPAMVATFIFGGLLVMVPGMIEPPAGWLHAKLTLVLILAGFHGFLVRCVKQFAHGHYAYSSKAFRYLNELPPIIMIFIIFLVVFKPF
jgi:putative membrane protein